MTEMLRYDVIIIGSGAGGSTLAHRLATTGKRILVLERGDWLPRESQNWESREVFGRKRYFTKETWRDRAGKELKPSTLYCVGGNTKIYGAALFRLRESDFTETQHADGISPAWPLSYILAQFIGGWLGLAIAVLPVRRAAAQEQVNTVLTQPGEFGTLNAFVAEFCISFVLMVSLLPSPKSTSTAPG